MGKLLAKIPDDNPRHESEAERNDRNYQELLQEMRVMQAGIQILFGFLLSLAFQSRFSEVTDFQRDVYLATLIGAMLSTGFMIASVPFHRLVFRRGMKEDLIRATQRFVGAGLTFLFLTMVGAVLLVFDFLVSRPAAIVVTAALALAYLILWLVIPVHQRAKDNRRQGTTNAEAAVD